MLKRQHLKQNCSIIEKIKFCFVFLRCCFQSSRILTGLENVLQFIHYPKNSALTKCTSYLLWKMFSKIYGVVNHSRMAKIVERPLYKIHACQGARV